MDTDTEKRKWSALDAGAVARDLVSRLGPVCERIEVAGSLRRRKPLVGDVELVFVPRFETRRSEDGFLAGFAAERCVDLAAERIEALVTAGVLARRPNKDGRESWGPLNKLAVHVVSGIPVDLFTTDRTCWWNTLVCRTGGAAMNIAIAKAALERGLSWNISGAGFLPVDGKGRAVIVRSEADVFSTVGLRYREPWERD